MKKINGLILCLMAAVMLSGLAACSRQDQRESTRAETSADREESSQDKTDENQPLEKNMDEDEGGGAGSTGSTEGETGVLEGLMDDAADGAEEMLDGEDRESSSDRGKRELHERNN